MYPYCNSNKNLRYHWKNILLFSLFICVYAAFWRVFKLHWVILLSFSLKIEISKLHKFMSQIWPMLFKYIISIFIFPRLNFHGFHKIISELFHISEFSEPGSKNSFLYMMLSYYKKTQDSYTYIQYSRYPVFLICGDLQFLDPCNLPLCSLFSLPLLLITDSILHFFNLSQTAFNPATVLPKHISDYKWNYLKKFLFCLDPVK